MADAALVYQKIAAVSAELAKEGIGKTRKNQQQNYQFRGIDDVLNALAPMLSTHGLVILPRILTRECSEREAKSGGTLFTVVVSAAFDFVAAEDGSTHTVQTFGEAMDSADKATNKAMSAAYKYAAFLAFCIPTEGDNDADATTHEPKPSTASTPPKFPATRHAVPETHSAPAGDDWRKVTGLRKAKTGQSAKGPWTLWIVAFEDGSEFKTFDDDIAAKLDAARKRGADVVIACDGDKITNVPSVSA